MQRSTHEIQYVPLFGCVYESYKHRKWYLAKGIHQMFHPQKSHPDQRSKLSLSFVAFWVASQELQRQTQILMRRSMELEEELEEEELKHEVWRK